MCKFRPFASDPTSEVFIAGLCLMLSDNDTQYDRKIRSHEQTGCTTTCARQAGPSRLLLVLLVWSSASLHLCMEAEVFCPVGTGSIHRPSLSIGGK